MRKLILSKDFVTERWTVYGMIPQSVDYVISSLRGPVLLRDADIVITVHRKGGRLPSNDREIPLYTPICLQTSHFENKVDKVGGSEVRRDAMVKRMMSKHLGCVRQEDAV